MSEVERIFDERERAVLREAMERDDMSAEGVVRHFFRMGQLVDLFVRQRGYQLLFRKGDETVDPFYVGPKMAPIPTDVWEGEGGSPAPARSCNRHSDCDRAEEEVMSRRGITRAEIHPSFHCHDDECEDCFGA